MFRYSLISRNERAAINEHYENLWQEYESKYKQLHHYKILEQKKEEVRAVEKKMEMLQEEEEKLKSAIEGNVSICWFDT